MADIKDTLANLKRGPSDVVGIELDVSEIRAVRMRKNNNDEITVLAAGILDSIDFTTEKAASALLLPAKLKAKYASITIAGGNSMIKLLSFPGQFDGAAEGKLVDNLGLENPDEYRISYKLITEGHGKSESRVLTVAIPEADAAIAPILLPAGLPAPFSLEISGLATMSAFLNGPGEQHAEESVGSIHFGSATSTFSLFNKNTLALIRRFNIGTNSVLDKVQEALGVDRETAQGILTDGAFDISQSVSEVMEPLVKQLVVSRDFVERRENCHISKMYVSGGLTASRDSLDEMRSALGIDVDFWNPFESLNVQSDAVPADLKGQEWRFSAAIGAVLATYEES